MRRSKMEEASFTLFSVCDIDLRCIFFYYLPKLRWSRRLESLSLIWYTNSPKGHLPKSDPGLIPATWIAKCYLRRPIIRFILIPGYGYFWVSEVRVPGYLWVVKLVLYFRGFLGKISKCQLKKNPFCNFQHFQ